MTTPTITVHQWALLREYAMRAILEDETDLVENPEDFGPEGIAETNKKLDEVRAVVRTLDAGTTRIILEKAA